MSKVEDKIIEDLRGELEVATEALGIAQDFACGVAFDRGLEMAELERNGRCSGCGYIGAWETMNTHVASCMFHPVTKVKALLEEVVLHVQESAPNLLTQFMEQIDEALTYPADIQAAHQDLNELFDDRRELVRARKAMSSLGVDKGHLPALIQWQQGEILRLDTLVAEQDLKLMAHGHDIGE